MANPQRQAPNALFVLGIDTCGPSGSAALARVTADQVEVVGEEHLAGRTYSATLVAAVEHVLGAQRIQLRDLACIVIVNGPGSFTGVRVGLSAAKGLAEGAGLPLIAVSRLEALAHKSGLPASALDAHRHEVFLRVPGRELLAGAGDLATLDPPSHVAVCDNASATLLAHAWPFAELVPHEPPTAADAIRLAAPRIRARESDDIALLDGHYLRRSDAEIFGDKLTA